jgi:hypothetical protein
MCALGALDKRSLVSRRHIAWARATADPVWIRHPRVRGRHKAAQQQHGAEDKGSTPTAAPTSRNGRRQALLDSRASYAFVPPPVREYRISWAGGATLKPGLEQGCSAFPARDGSQRSAFGEHADRPAAIEIDIVDVEAVDLNHCYQIPEGARTGPRAAEPKGARSRDA